MKKYLLYCPILFLCLLIFTDVRAQTTIAPEKKKLIGELILLTKTDKQIVEVTDTILKSMEATYPAIIEQTASRQTGLSEADRKIVVKTMTENFQSFARKFRERLAQEIDYRQYVEDAVYPLYDKFFTERELADLIAFYKTETGQKVITTMPQLFAESSRLSESLLLPKILKLVDEIIQEDLKSLRQPPKKAN